jgi:hypothetical protein
LYINGEQRIGVEIGSGAYRRKALRKEKGPEMPGPFQIQF